MLLGIDLGTSSVKAAVMAEDGAIKQVARETYRVGVPNPGWAETDPADWWLAARQAVRRLDPKHLRRIKAIGLAGQMHGVVLTNADGRPLRPAIVWADSRSVGELGSYRRLSPRLRRLLGNGRGRAALIFGSSNQNMREHMTKLRTMLLAAAAVGAFAGTVLNSGSAGWANRRKSFTIRSRRRISRSTSWASACSWVPG